ncbi:BON domain-containing protein (plasmid) [Paraburkholderia sp. D15]|uniref:BON domain-containing protein n=1 Tax=Paraburkholderia sp. D15 TaxID=2880218 RepID=UPI0024788291|nr:BON domain-containing protein [Paraburkholderia sp. D15]WGS55273.1 BON domain-containing protein [Paraburkholderia sp. D15]
MEMMGIDMRTANLFKALCAAFCMAMLSASYAQPGDATEPASATASAAAPSLVDRKLARKQDRKLSVDVRRALAVSKDIDVTNIFVRARGGAITLTGSVREAGQIQKAEDIASHVKGVTSLTNKLTLQPQYGH